MDILERASSASLTSTFSSLVGEVTGIQTLVTGLKEVTDKKIHGSLNLQLNRNKGFIDELAKFIDGLQQAPDIDSDDPDDLDADEEEAAAPRTGRAAAVNAYMQAVRAQARTQEKNAALAKAHATARSSSGSVIEGSANQTELKLVQAS